MIELSKLNGHPFVVNAELIKFVEQNPDTVLTLVTGDKIVVREAAPEVMHRVLAYRRELLRADSPLPGPDSRQADTNAHLNSEPSAKE